MSKDSIIDVSGSQNQDPDSYRGSEAQNVDIKLSENKGQSQVSISGTQSGEVDFTGTLEIFAKGRNGRHGKIGRNGHHGRDGADGYNATMFTFGTDGHPGEDGGNGQPGTDGEDAGPGGDVSITVTEQDKALLEILGNIDVSSGDPGHAGHHGHGGRGGRGGRGGNSFTWNTTINEHGRVIIIPHHMPGGHDGPDGRDGYTPTTPLYPGRSSSNGTLKFFTLNDNKTITSHHTPYNFSLNPYKQLKTRYEFGETISIDYQVSNNSQTMATPVEDTPVILHGNDYSTPIQNGIVQGNIDPQTYAVSKKPISFQINHPNTIQSTPLKQEIITGVHLENTRLGQPFKKAWREDSIIAEYPVYLEPQEVHLTLEQGKSIDVFANVTQHIYPEKANPTQDRIVKVQMTHQNKVLKELTINTKDNWIKDHSSSSILLPSDAELFSKTNVTVDLYLQAINAKLNDSPILIQQQHITVQVAESYKPQGSGFLLVMNANTSPAAIKYWKGVLSELGNGKEIDVWNSSLYKTLPWDQNNSIQNTTHGTVVILDNQYSQNKQHDSTNLNQQVRYNVNKQYGTKFVVVGPNEPLRNKYLNGSDLTWSETNTVPQFNSSDLLIAHLVQKDKIESKHPSFYKLTIPLTYTSCCTTTKLDARSEAQKIENQLNKTFPNRKYFIDVQDLNEQALLRIQEVPLNMDSEVNWISKNDSELTQENYSPNNQEIDSVVSALPFTQKIQLLFANSKNKYHKQLADNLLKDLLNEQDLLRTVQFSSSCFQNIKNIRAYDFKNELKKLSELVHSLKPEMVSEFGPLIIRLIANVQYHAEQHSSFWSKLAQMFARQVNEEVRLKSYELGQEALIRVYRKKEFQKSVDSEKERVSFRENLKQFIKDNKNQNLYYIFSRRLNTEELKAAEAILEAIDLVDEYNHWIQTPQIPSAEVFGKNNALLAYYNRFTQLYPVHISKKFYS